MNLSECNALDALPAHSGNSFYERGVYISTVVLNGMMNGP